MNQSDDQLFFTLPDGRQTEVTKSDFADMLLSDIDYVEEELLTQLDSMRRWLKSQYREVTRHLGGKIQFVYKTGYDLEADGIKDADLLAVVLEKSGADPGETLVDSD